MDILFSDISEVQAYVSEEIAADLDNIKPFIFQAKKFVTRQIGKPAYDELLAYYVAGTNDNPLLDALLPYVRFPLVNFAYMLAVPRRLVKHSELGLSLIATGDFEPVEQWHTNDLKKAFAEAGYNGLEDLLLFIEENKADYPTAAAYMFDNRFFVHSASEMNTLLATDVYMRDFVEIRKEIVLSEESVRAAVGDELFAQLKTAAKDGTEDNDLNAMLDNYVRTAVAAMAYHKKYDSPEHARWADSLLEALRDYIAVPEAVPRLENGEDYSGFIFGQA